MGSSEADDESKGHRIKRIQAVPPHSPLSPHISIKIEQSSTVGRWGLDKNHSCEESDLATCP